MSDPMTRKWSAPGRRSLVAVLLAAHVVGLGWGYVRLPWAAIDSMADHRLIREARSVSLSPWDVDISATQQWYLGRCLPLTTAAVVPRINVSVHWNALVLARVSCGHYVSSTGGEITDRLYICLFGAWVPVYTFHHEMA